MATQVTTTTLAFSHEMSSYDIQPFEKSIILVIRKTYEFSDHLGNVSATISDRKITIATTAGNAVLSYTPEVLSQEDYFPFGMGMMGRSVTAEGYRYGYNGMEKEPDTFEGAYDFGARILDARLGRWLSVDRDFFLFPDISPMAFVANSPLVFIDPDGNKLINAFDQKIKEQQLVIEEKQVLYNSMIQSYINQGKRISGFRQRRIEKKSGLRKAKEEMKDLQKKQAIVNKFFDDLKDSNLGEYLFFENLKDYNEDPVYIIVDLIEGKSKDYALTIPDQKMAFVKDEGSEEVLGLQKSSPDCVTDFKVNLFEYVPEETIFDPSTNQNETAYGTGWDFGSFANELGDIKYMFTEIKTTKDIELWRDSAGDKGSLYWSNEKGAGHYSREYEKQRVKDLNDINKKSD